MTKYEHITYDQLHGYYHELVRGMHTAHYVPDVIIAPMRGGVDLGVKLSNYFDCPVIALHWQTRDGLIKDSDTLTDILSKYLTENILIVDDICDSGKTFKQISDVVDSFQENIHVDYAAAIANLDSEFQVNWLGRLIYRNTDTQWFVFPWEEWWKQS